MNFWKSVNRSLYKYVDFNGRASRAEFWYFHLFVAIVAISFYEIGLFIDPVAAKGISALAIVSLLIPSIAVSVRRLHDTGRSGTIYLTSWVPLIGIAIMAFYACMPSDDGLNQYDA